MPLKHEDCGGTLTQSELGIYECGRCGCVVDVGIHRNALSELRDLTTDRRRAYTPPSGEGNYE